MVRRLGATAPRADEMGRARFSSPWQEAKARRRRNQEEVIGREDGDTYIAVFCDLQICGPLEKRRRHLCYFGNET